MNIGYNETFFPVSKRDSLKIVLALVAHYDFDLHQIDVKAIFLNGDLEKKVYIDLLKSFVTPEKENSVCKLNNSIYRLKQTSRLSLKIPLT